MTWVLSGLQGTRGSGTEHGRRAFRLVGFAVVMPFCDAILCFPATHRFVSMKFRVRTKAAARGTFVRGTFVRRVNNKIPYRVRAAARLGRQPSEDTPRDLGGVAATHAHLGQQLELLRGRHSREGHRRCLAHAGSVLRCAVSCSSAPPKLRGGYTTDGRVGQLPGCVADTFLPTNARFIE